LFKKKRKGEKRKKTKMKKERNKNEKRKKTKMKKKQRREKIEFSMRSN